MDAKRERRHRFACRAARVRRFRYARHGAPLFHAQSWAQAPSRCRCSLAVD